MPPADASLVGTGSVQGITYSATLSRVSVPYKWVNALDPDKSREAVVLERAMTEAMQVLPELVLDAVLNVDAVIDDEV
jgi:hypothetical protein